MATIPPWLNINPLEPARFYLQAFRQGSEIGQANRRNEVAEAEFSANRADAATRETARQEEFAFRQRQAERAAALQEKAREIQIAQAERALQLKEEQATREAEIARYQLEGTRGLMQDIEEGIPIQEAFPRWAPKLLVRHPEAIGREYKAMQPPASPVWVPPGNDGAPGHFESGGRVTIPPGMGADRSELQIRDIQGVPFVVNRGGHFERLHKEPTGNASAEARTRASILAQLIRSGEGDVSGYIKELEELNNRLKTGSAQPLPSSDAPTKALPQPRTQEEVDKIIAEANAAIKNKNKDPVAVRARLKAMGIVLEE